MACRYSRRAALAAPSLWPRHAAAIAVAAECIGSSSSAAFGCGSAAGLAAATPPSSCDHAPGSASSESVERVVSPPLGVAVAVASPPRGRPSAPSSRPKTV